LNTTELTYLLNNPRAINEKQTIALEAVLQEFPFFQGARALNLKVLYNQDSFRYNNELKKTASITTDRVLLFELITSPQFITIQKSTIDENLAKIDEINVIDSQTIEEIIVSKEFTQENDLNIGKPLIFENNETHSFREWLQLTHFEPINRDDNVIEEEFDEEKQKKNDLIEKFIESNPKIQPIRENVKPPVNINKSIEDTSHLMTETLAKVYLEQKKYQRAIQAYDILILKYPEKSSFFADQIEKIKELQQNNN
jgi:hypothetical protein